MSRPSIDITLPVLNEAPTLRQQVTQLHSWLSENFREAADWRIVIVDNGSTDATPQIAQELSFALPQVSLLQVPRRGVGLALKHSWGQSQADIVGYMDLDLATDLPHFLEAYAALADQGYDLVYASRLHRDSKVVGRSFKREVASRGFNFLLRTYLGVGFSDGMCGFKWLYRHHLPALMAGGADNDGWFFSTELLTVAEWQGLRLCELPVKWTDDASSSKVKILPLAKRYLKAMHQLKKEKALTYDTAIIGGGLFGCHAALFLAERGERVLLIDAAPELITRASIVNQARLHAGYHYPRSIATARASDENIARFREEFADCINDSFTHYYAIAAHGSLTDPRQFERFCNQLQLPCERVDDHPAFNYQQLAAVYRTVEHSFDPLLLAAKYRERITRGSLPADSSKAGAKIDLRLNTRLDLDKQVEASPAQGNQAATFHFRLNNGEAVQAKRLINATYAAVNTINRHFGMQELSLMHEIAEMAFVRAPGFSAEALTVMDGPFCSLMPWGKTGLLSLSSVAYTHQRVSYGAQPRFSCQDLRPDCRPEATADCQGCPQAPPSNYPKMLAQLRRYLSPDLELEYVHSRFTIKSKLQANYIDDGRPTAVRQLSQDPDYFCVFAGKVNSVYSIEQLLR